MNRGPDPAKNLLVIRPIIPGQVIRESNFQPSKLKTLQPFRIKLVSLENGIISYILIIWVFRNNHMICVGNQLIETRRVNR